MIAGTLFLPATWDYGMFTCHITPALVLPLRKISGLKCTTAVLALLGMSNSRFSPLGAYLRGGISMSAFQLYEMPASVSTAYSPPPVNRTALVRLFLASMLTISQLRP